MTRTREQLEMDLEEKVLDGLLGLPWDQYIKIAAKILDVAPEDIEEVFRRAK